jgi:signal peptidase II
MFIIKKSTVILFAVFFLSLDRILKTYAILFKPKLYIAGDILKFNYTSNPYIAFSLPISGIFLNILIVIMIISLLFLFVRQIKKEKLSSTAFCLLLIILGAISNLWDRFKFGFVIDYLDLKYFTVFNLADVLISFGVITLLLLNIKAKDH